MQIYNNICFIAHTWYTNVQHFKDYMHWGNGAMAPSARTFKELTEHFSLVQVTVR